MTTLGFVYRLEWHNPYTEPPAGQPRILAEIFVPSPRSALVPPELDALHRIGSGYSLTIRAVGEPPAERSPEAKASDRRRRLQRRMQDRYPLLADDFAAAEISRKPGYYLDGLSDHDATRAARIANERAELARLTANANKLVVYGEI